LSRFNPHRAVAPIYEAAAHWRDRCFSSEGSALTADLALWTPALLDELDRCFVQNLDEGEGTFFEKLRAQLPPRSPACQLMAEHLWVLMLFQSNVGAATKRENVRQVWSWSGQSLADSPLLADATLGGIGSTGTAYNTHRWRELVFLISLARDFKGQRSNERAAILAGLNRAGFVGGCLV
jgi:5-methylcytosine-specific restriction protein B